MVMSSQTQLGSKNLPIINLLAYRSKVSKGIVDACDKFGYFKDINHGIPNDIIEKVK